MRYDQSAKFVPPEQTWSEVRMIGIPKPSAPSRVLIISAFTAVYLIWGSTYLAIRFAVEVLPPFFMVGTRFLISGSILYLWARLSGAPRPDLSQWKPAAMVGMLLLVFGNGLISWSEQRIPSGLAALLTATVPFWMVILDWTRHHGAAPTSRTVLGLIIGFMGVALLCQPWSSSGGNRFDLLGAGMVMVAALSFATGSLYSVRANLPSSPMLSMGMEMLSGGVIALGVGMLRGEPANIEVSAITGRSLLALTYLILFGSLVGFNAYMWLLRVCRPAWVSTYAFVNPVIAVILGWALGGEPLTASTLMAALLIVLSVFFITFLGARHGSSTELLRDPRRKDEID
jgi:drug/metabolite transporter (DMT)-like permease